MRCKFYGLGYGYGFLNKIVHAFIEDLINFHLGMFDVGMLSSPLELVMNCFILQEIMLFALYFYLQICKCLIMLHYNIFFGRPQR